MLPYVGVALRKVHAADPYAARVGLGSSRPLLLGNVRGTLKALLEERSPVYEAVSAIVVDTDGRTPDEVANLVQEALDG